MTRGHLYPCGRAPLEGDLVTLGVVAQCWSDGTLVVLTGASCAEVLSPSSVTLIERHP